VQRLQALQRAECFDPVDPASKPTERQLECLKDINRISHRYVTAGNQAGKSQLGARECAWVFEENHPFWQRRPEWRDEPLLLLVVGRTTKQIEEVLWRKISAFLDPDDIQVQRVGGVIQKVTHRKNKNTILFLSHHSEREAREKVQAYVAHWVWCDELPGSVKLVEELHRRSQAKRGTFLSTFTPKVPNPEIRRLVDNSRAPLAKKYQFSMLDNPIYSDEDKHKIRESLKTYPKAYQNTILFGDWADTDTQVYFFDRESMVEIPEGYHPAWRHVESSDPALQSKFGFTIWAERPGTESWYLIRADYITGIPAPEDIFAEVMKRTAGLNIVRRISDPHEAWYINTASAKGVAYVTPYDKNSRKGELIKNLQQALSTWLKIAPWCEDFIDEVEHCQWSEKAANKIVNASSFHLLDAAQYFVDCRPKPDLKAAPKSWEQELREANEKRKQSAKVAAAVRSRARVSGRSKWLLGKSTYKRLS
jgi:phage terminase large subunit-like protein